MSFIMNLFFVALKTILSIRNVRLTKNLNLPPLIADILENGLTEPIGVRKLKDGNFEILKGHRRYESICFIEENYPEEFKKLFPKGIPINEYVGISDREAVRIKLDHNTQEALSDPMELYYSAVMLFEQGETNNYICNTLSNTMARLKQMDVATVNILKDIEHTIEVLKATDANADLIKVEEDKYKTTVFEYWKGRLAPLKAMWKCPEIIEATKLFHATGKKPDGFKDVEMPVKLSQSKIVALRKESDKDFADTNKAWTKKNPGPMFMAAWKKHLEADAKRVTDKASGVATPKAMSAKDMNEEISKYNSELARLLTKRHAGEEVDAMRIKELDNLAADTELVNTSTNPADKALIADIKAQATECRITTTALAVEAGAEVTKAKSKKKATK